MTLLPLGDRPYPLGVEWSLVYEVAFYLVMGLSIFIPTKIRPVILIFWLIVIALSAYIRPGYATVYVPNIEQVLLSGFCLPFIFGALAAWFSQQIQNPRLIIHWALGLFCIVLVAYIKRVETDLLLLGFGFANIVFAFAWTAFSQSKVMDILKAFGDCSYGIYLAQIPVLALTTTSMGTVDAQGDFIPVFLFVLGIGSIVGIIDCRIQSQVKSMTRAASIKPN
jgi:exopolysaccharide production protein ExoZ